ncbi:MAG: hypothetical protein KAU90_09440, partial [Sulfurovaceae bacterium]|nr:hypothetical protein [Sulfurovaceae bacterium]
RLTNVLCHKGGDTTLYFWAKYLEYLTALDAISLASYLSILLFKSIIILESLSILVTIVLGEDEGRGVRLQPPKTNSKKKRENLKICISY